MAKIPDLAAPGSLRPWWMVPAVSGQTTNVRLTLAHLGSVPRGAVALSLADYIADAASTIDSDPGAGKLRWNHATQASATEIYLSDDDANVGDHSGVWAGLNPGGFLYLYKAGDLDVWQEWQITAVVPASGYVKLSVTWQASNGTFADSDPVVATIQQPSPSPGVDRNIVTTVSSASGTLTLDASLGDYFKTTLSENTTLALSNVPQACTLSLSITQDSPARTLAWPGSFKFREASVVSTAAGARDRLIITTDDFGATWDADLGKGYS